MLSGTHGRAVGFSHSSIQRAVPDVRSRPAGLSLELCGSQSAVEPHSGDGSMLAVGSHDNFIYLYNVSERGRKYSRYGKCTVSLSSFIPAS
ncbi:hypothetical protein GOODEAATRI_030971, partial [Goodea atripinnis]